MFSLIGSALALNPVNLQSSDACSDVASYLARSLSVDSGSDTQILMSQCFYDVDLSAGEQDAEVTVVVYSGGDKVNWMTVRYEGEVRWWGVRPRSGVERGLAHDVEEELGRMDRWDLVR